MEECLKGNHNLITILESEHPYGGSSQVARWCTECGSIVVDVDYDGRTNAGQVMKMKSPTVAKNYKSNKEKQ